MSTPYDDLPPPRSGDQPYGAPPAGQHGGPAAPPAPAETGPVEYHLIQRTGRWGRDGWWRPLVGVTALFVLAILVLPTALVVAFVVWFAIRGQDVRDSTEALADLDNVTPSVLAFVNLNWAVAIPAAFFVLWLFHRLGPGWLSSVAGRIRVRWMLTCFGLAVVALVLTVVVSTVLPSAGSASDLGGPVNDWTTTVRDFVLVIVLLTPLQAAGEEYVFRGYLTQSFGGLFAPLGPQLSRAAAVLVPALIFAMAHGAQEVPIFIDRFAFGLVSGILVISTGGLEAGIAMHVLNNFLAFGVALAFSDMTSAMNPSGSSWWQVPTTLTQSIGYLVLATLVARRMGIATRTAGLLEAPSPRV